MKRRVAMTVLIIFLFLTPKVFADAVYLTSGDIIKGLVVEEHQDRIVFSTYKGEITILKINIDQIFFDNEEQNYTYLGDKAFTEGNSELALGLYQKAYQINPEYARLNGAFLRMVDVANRKKLNIRPEGMPGMLKEQIGITIERYKDKIKIVSVENNSSAQRAGLHKGDFITTVWDISVMYMDPAQAVEILVGGPVTPVKFSVEKEINLPVKQPANWFEKIFHIFWFNDFGFKLSLTPSGLTVSSVDKSGMAAKYGLKVNDMLTHINNESTRYMPVSMVRKKIFESKLKEVVLSVKRDTIVMRGGQK